MGRQQGAGAGPAGRAGAGSRGGNYGGGGRVRFRGRGGRGRGGSSSRGRGGGKAGDAGPSLQTEDGTKDDDLAENAAARDEIDEKLGFGRISAGPPKVGWLVNMSATTIRDEAFPAGRSGVDFYFIEESGSMVGRSACATALTRAVQVDRAVRAVPLLGRQEGHGEPGRRVAYAQV